MYPRFAFALLFSVCAFGLGIAIPAFPEQKCGANAVFLTCGSACVPDCANPEPPKFCTLQCVMDCFCQEGFLKNAKGECVRPQECEARTQETPMDFEIPQCPNNEEFQACGSACAPTCANPHPSPVCTKNCVIGCFCKPGYLRTKLGLCVPANQCEAPQTAAFFAYPPEVSQCKENEFFMPCGSACAPTCANPHPGPMCTMQCVVGCFCKPGYLKNEHGVCVPSESCGVPAAEAMPMPPQMCGENEEFRQCKGCDGTCDNPNPICPRICIQGCACKEGHFRNGPNGKCVLAQQCPPMPAVAVMPLPPHVCGENEEFRQCKGCDGTCANPNPLCPRICIPGCACKQGHLRSGPNGKCIMAQQCPQVDPVPATSFMMLPPVPQCGANEEFHSCGTACPATCANPHPSPVCTKNCVIGCFCKPGYLKNAQGVCVPAANCEAPQPMMASAVQPAGQCSSDREIFSECGEQLDCLASCNTPLPFLIHGEPQLPKKCLERKCTPGCVCQKPYVRHADGRCVEVNECQHDSPFTTPSH
jgi:hypothetical protein